MKTQSVAIASVLGVLFAGFTVTEAGKETIEVTEGAVTFTVDTYDDGRNKPYRVTWNDPDDGFLCQFKFNMDGVVTNIETDGDTYKVLYGSNGNLRRVRRTSSRRTLTEGGQGVVAEVVDANDSIHTGGHRRLYDCGDCEDTVNTLVSNGAPSVCNLVGYGDPILDSAARSIDVFCDNFQLLIAEEACEGQCESECLAPLTVALEWFDDADLDLRVAEPGAGDRVFYGNRGGKFGYLDQDNTSGPEDGPEQYIVYGGFPASSTASSSSEEYPLGQYWLVVHNYSNDYARFKLTATTGSGEVILDEEGTIDPECGGENLARFFRVDLSGYVDNDCDLPDMAQIEGEVAAEGDQPTKD